MRVPAAVAAVPLLFGSAVSLLGWPELPPHLAVAALGGATIALLSAATCVGERDAPCATIALTCGFVCAGLTLGWVAAERAYRPSLLTWYSHHQPLEPVRLEGVLREDAAVTPFGVSLALDVDRVNDRQVLGGVRLTVSGELAPTHAGVWRSGRRVALPASLRQPSTYRDPGVPDDVAALARRGFCLVGAVKSAALVERLADGSRLQEAAAAARMWARRRLAESIGPTSERSAAIATAILIGDRSRLRQEDEKRLQRAGTYHVIAISGGNIALVTAALLLVARLLVIPHRVGALLTIAALLFYALVTGPAASVQRAVTAAVIFLAARVIDHRGPPLNALAVAALVLIAASPVSILDPGFLLSFAATLGILLGAPVLLSAPQRDRERIDRRVVRSLARAIAAMLVATVCADVMLLPIAATVFGRVTGAGLLLNLLAIPLMSIVQIAGSLVLLGGAGVGLGRAAVSMTHLAATGLVESARLIDVVPWLSTLVPAPSVWLMTAYYMGAACLLARRVRRVAAACVMACVGLMLAGPIALSRDGVPRSRFPLRVIVLDVGQGDATVVSTADGRALLVDAGGVASFGALEDDHEMAGFDVGERVVVRTLRALDVPRLSALVLTHGDPDHMLGAPAVLDAFRVASVWEGVPVPRNPGLQALRRLGDSKAVSWRTVQAGDVEGFGDIQIRVLHPPLPEWERQRIRNEDSIVLEVRLGNVSVVLTGDIGREGEHAILSRLDPGRVTILKAAHHGSATSSTPEFLAALNPAAVIFSAGRQNRFGHPHPGVVQRFRDIGSTIFRTDEDGAVFVETDGRRVEVRGWTGRVSVFEGSTPSR